MTKNIAQLKSVFRDGSVSIRGSGALIEGVSAKTKLVIPDERGRLGEILRSDDPWFTKFGQLYFTTTYPGIVKAWHHHKIQTDFFYVVKGLVKIALYDQRQDSKTCGVINEIYLGEHNPGMVRIPPGVLHGWMCVSDCEAIIINLPTELYNYSNPDEYRVDPHDNDIPYDWTRKDG